MQENWRGVEALSGDTAQMRKEGNRYPAQWPAKGEKSDQVRLGTGTLFPAFTRTIPVLTGKPFSKAVSVGDDVPTRIADSLENID